MEQNEIGNQEEIECWIASAKQGDADAIGRLLAEYRNYLVFLARAQTHQRLQAKGDPSDIAQETCLAAAEGMKRFVGNTGEEFAAWLRGILVKKIAMHLRQYLGTEKRNVQLEIDVNQSVSHASNFLDMPFAASMTSPSQDVAKKERGLALASALEALKPDYREVILLRHMDGLPFSEVAKKMERSVDSVEKLWVRALGKLRGLLGESHGGS